MTLGGGSRLRRGPYAYSAHRGLFTPHGRSATTASSSACEHAALFWQLARFTACARSIVDPSGSARTPAGPSIHDERSRPPISGLQSSSGVTSSIPRSIIAPAAYRVSRLSRKCPAMIVSDEEVSISAPPSAVSGVSAVPAVSSGRRDTGRPLTSSILKAQFSPAGYAVVAVPGSGGAGPYEVSPVAVSLGGCGSASYVNASPTT